ncbi:GntR family transcriptional regulator [Desulfobacula sp.]|uniref:GntR family transcriptional regulator n=1 Tax=Desulfobacula sp. TaxID=2593537 RepID=UPI0026069EAB|nr:GntR family transcriptional regulator [Desulfobacula sp.]
MEFPGLTENLVDLIRKKIIIGEFEPGQKINEIGLAKSMNISRSPLREALRILETEHLVSYTPRKGNSVSTISLEDLSEVYRIREMIECFAIDLLEEKQIQAYENLALCLDRMVVLEAPPKSATSKEKLCYVETLAQFHLEMIKLTGNKRLIDSYMTIYFNINRYVFLYAFTKGAIEHSVEDHVQIVNYLKEGKYQKARQTVRDHVRRACEDCKRS